MHVLSLPVLFLTVHSSLSLSFAFSPVLMRLQLHACNARMRLVCVCDVTLNHQCQCLCYRRLCSIIHTQADAGARKGKAININGNHRRAKTRSNYVHCSPSLSKRSPFFSSSGDLGGKRQSGHPVHMHRYSQQFPRRRVSIYPAVIHACLSLFCFHSISMFHCLLLTHWAISAITLSLPRGTSLRMDLVTRAKKKGEREMRKYR